MSIKLIYGAFNLRHEQLRLGHNVNIRACPAGRTSLRPLGATGNADRQAMMSLSLGCEFAQIRTYASLLAARGGVSLSLF